DSRDDSHPASQRLGVGQNVRAEKYGAPALAKANDELAHLLAAQRVQARHRLIEKNHFRLVDHGLREADALDHAFGELPELEAALGADADFIEDAADARANVSAAIAE